MSWARFLLALPVLVLFLPLSAGADTLALSWDNDLMVGSDGRYTNGVRLSFVGDTHDDCGRQDGAVCTVARGLDLLPGIDAAGNSHTVTISLEQAMITPSDITREQPDFNDLPYAGLTNLEMGLFSRDDDSMVGYGFRFGVLGPDSLAEQAQTWVHELTGSDEPKGWDDQLGQDLIGGIWVSGTQRMVQWGGGGGLETEAGYAWAVDANNFLGNAQVGGFVRAGRNLPGNLIPDYSGFGTAGSLVGVFDKPGFGWEVFVGASGQYIGYSYIVEHSGPYHVDGRDTIAGLIVGGSVRWDRFATSLTLRGSTSPVRDSKKVLSYGNLSFMWAL
ncbi:lipid A deacylase LpxR family protein [Marinobacter mobilis]|uniref:Lipid A deacylase LpxR family protein n=1 Tax=Marinobacter mobilis TaxID=488533 RepID=A0A1H2S725_9GAMM|nr:lipid A deacylase LpxR family protein [Marinobacter mobilis]SDW27482.1 hypothetical protein SAMN04487960_10245 [Marinobacter mobilis]